MLRLRLFSCATLALFLLVSAPKAFSVPQEPKVSSTTVKKTNRTISKKASNKTDAKKAGEIKVTFIELGSVRCIPCKMMQPVIKEIENEYGKKGVKVVFYDVWTEAGRPYAEKYAIQAIPTQVFLDSRGKEYFRHTGFFPKEELLKVLKEKGVE